MNTAFDIEHFITEDVIAEAQAKIDETEKIVGFPYRFLYRISSQA